MKNALKEKNKKMLLTKQRKIFKPLKAMVKSY